MQLVTVDSIDRTRQWIGAIRRDGRYVDLQSGAQALFGDKWHDALSSMLALIEAGDDALDAARDVLSVAEAADGLGGNWQSIDPTAVHLRTPIPNPPQIRDCLMFEDHLINAYAKLRLTRASLEPDPAAALARYDVEGLYKVPYIWYELPLYYKANRFSVIGSEQDIIWPDYTENLDFELEYGAFLKCPTKDVTPEQAERNIFGYSIFNDVSARDIQSREMQGQLGPAKGKDFDTGNIIGPCIVTADAVDTGNLTMRARVNGKEWACGNSGSARWKFGEVIAYMSKCETLVPGEFIGSGTVGGGCGLEYGQLLKPGDLIELEVDGIGILRNRVVRHSTGVVGSGSLA